VEVQEPALVCFVLSYEQPVMNKKNSMKSMSELIAENMDNSFIKMSTITIKT